MKKYVQTSCRVDLNLYLSVTKNAKVNDVNENEENMLKRKTIDQGER